MQLDYDYIEYNEDFDDLATYTRGSVYAVFFDKNKKVNIVEKSLYSKKEKMEDLDKKGDEQDRCREILEEDIFSCCDKIENILENNSDDLSDRAKNRLVLHSEKINSILSIPKHQQIIFENKPLSEPVESVVKETITKVDELGLELSPLEIEVAEMMSKVKNGEKPFDDYVPYNRAIHRTPLDYLKEHYKKYLKAFNGIDDCLYQDQLEVIDSKFRNNLRTWLKRDGQDINDYVPTKSVRLDKQAKALKENPEIRKVRVTDSMKKHSKIISLKIRNRL